MKGKYTIETEVTQADIDAEIQKRIETRNELLNRSLTESEEAEIRKRVAKNGKTY